MRRRLRKVLPGIKFLECEYALPAEGNGQFLALVLVLFLVIYTLITVKEKPRCGSSKNIALISCDPDLRILIPGGAHAAGDKSLPDQVIQTILIS